MRYDQQWSQQQQQPQPPQWQPQYPQYPQYQSYPQHQFPQQSFYPYQPHPHTSPLQSQPPSQSQQRIINTEEDKQKLFNVCKTGRGNAHLLHEALVYAKPNELKGQGLIQEFLSRCRASLELIYSQIPWATSEAARSSNTGSSETVEEQLLAALLGANEELLEAIKMYEDLERAGQEHEKQERKIQERKLRALEALAAFRPTTAESAVVKQVFEIGDTLSRGVITSHAAAKIFMGSKLSPKVLANIWEIANVEESDILSKQAIGAAIRLIGHAQKLGPKGKLDAGLLDSAGHLAVIEGLDSEVPHRRLSINQAAGSSHGYLPPLTAQDRNKFMKIFFNCGPKNGLLGGDRARELLMRSQLSMDQLAQVWDLADRDHRGHLDATGFIVAMYLIQATMAGQLMSIPSSLPPAVYQAAASKTEVFNPNPTSWIDGLSVNSAPSSGWGASAGSSSSRSGSGSGLGSSSSFGGLGFGGGSGGASGSGGSMDPFADPHRWDVSPQTKATADEFFVLLDENGRGSIDLETARAHLTQPGITASDLKRIWELADVNKDYRLNQEEFAVVLHLIEKTKLGHPIPRTLPESLVPPASRPAAISSSNSNQSQTLEDVLIDLRDIHITPNSNPRHTTTNSLPTIIEPTPSHLNTQLSMPPLRQQHSQPPPSTRPSLDPSQIPTHTRSASVPAVPSQQSSSSVATSSPNPPLPPTPADWDWDVLPAEKARSDKFFDNMDPWKTGFIDGDAAVPFLSKSKLPDEVLAHIWDLADRDSDGKLSKEDFAVAMYLIRQKISGKPLPETLPPSLIPPSERTGASKPLPPEPVSEPEEDIFSDPPPAPAPTLVAPTPSPARSNSRMSGPRNGPRAAAAATAAPATPPLPASPEPPPPPPHGLPPEDDEPRSGTPPPPYTETDDLDLL